MNFLDKIKQKISNIIYKFFTKLQKFLIKNKVIKNKGRQPYHIGWLREGKTLEDLKIHLHGEWGFGNHFVSWIDDDQVLSWRKLVDLKYQYHLKIFKDGEIRGYYGYTPEANIINYLKRKDEKERKDDFIKFLGDFCVEEKYISELEMDPNVFDPKSEITIEHGFKK